MEGLYFTCARKYFFDISERLSLQYISYQKYSFEKNKIQKFAFNEQLCKTTLYIKKTILKHLLKHYNCGYGYDVNVTVMLIIQFTPRISSFDHLQLSSS